MNKMDAFCLESRYEGQGIVLWEARALGLPLIFPKRLEKYNINLKGTDCVVSALINLKKTEHIKDDLSEYNDYAIKQYKQLLNFEGDREKDEGNNKI